MSNLDSMLERNKDFAAQQYAAVTLNALASRGDAESQGNDHRLRRYARGTCSFAWTQTRRGPRVA
jgi:hypothetical protein